MVVDGRPGVVPGYGNCLFNSLSLLITGDFNSAAEIRYRTAVELIVNADCYKSNNKWSVVCGSIDEGII
jgi:hypothetical protein